MAGVGRGEKHFGKESYFNVTSEAKLRCLEQVGPLERSRSTPPSKTPFSIHYDLKSHHLCFIPFT